MINRNLVLRRINPLSAFRVALVMSLVGLVAWLLAVVLLYFGMDLAGIWDSVNGVMQDVGGAQTVTFGLIFGISALIGVVLAVLMTIIAPVLALIYNGVADLLGGVEVSLGERAQRR